MKSREALEELILNPSALMDRSYSRLCSKYFEDLYPGYKALLVTSCTKAIELIVASLNLSSSDEVIIPSYTFVGVANSVNNSGAKIVFADLNKETMNISIESIRKLIGTNTKALVVMHYAGVSCEMDDIVDLCEKHDIFLIEDNAQGIGCTFNGKLLGGYGDFSCISFDTMKTVSCGEGGVLLYKEHFHNQIIDVFNNGTNREDFEMGKTNCYEWICKGSKYAISEYLAGILYPLLLESELICNKRREIWDTIYNRLEENEFLRSYLPNIKNFDHQGHIFYLNCKSLQERNQLVASLGKKGIVASFHYTLLHLSKYAIEKDIKSDEISNAIEAADCLIRVPIYNQMSIQEIDYLCETLTELILD